MPFRSLRLGGVELAVGVEDGLVGRLRETALWKFRDKRSLPTPSSLAKSGGQRSVLERIAPIDWYHTIDVGDGVVTPGIFDHRPYLRHYPIPERLDGMRVLDVATFDGFFAFEFERRGAAEVVAIDVETVGGLDLPPATRAAMRPEELALKTGTGFQLASELRKSRVRRVICSVYDLSPERLGKFDLVMCGSLLLHLRDPLRALQAIRSVTGGTGIFAEVYDPGLPLRCLEYKGGTRLCVWWSFSHDCLNALIDEAGYSRTETLDTFGLTNIRESRPIWHAAFRVTP
jgi:tRNA (mo5U34)-methyltransferase